LFQKGGGKEGTEGKQASSTGKEGKRGNNATNIWNGGGGGGKGQNEGNSIVSKTGKRDGTRRGERATGAAYGLQRSPIRKKRTDGMAMQKH